MSYRLEIEILDLPKMPNQLLRRHWSTITRNKNKWLFAITRKVGARVPPEPLMRALVSFTRCSSVEPDFDGLVGSFKPVLDSLVRIGVLSSDKPSVIGQPSYAWEKAKQQAGKIKIKVEEIES